MLSALPTIGENIRRLRHAAGFKRQGDFAERVGVPQSRVSDWENDRYETIDTRSLVKLAKILSVPVDELLRGVDADYDRANLARSTLLNDRLQELAELVTRIRGKTMEELNREDFERLMLIALDLTHVSTMATHLWPPTSTEVLGAKKDQTPSSSGTSYANTAPVQSRGGSSHGQQHEAPGTPDHRAQSAPQSHAQVRQRLLTTQQEIHDTLERLRACVNGITADIDQLRSDAATSNSRTTESGGAGRRAAVRPRGAKSRRRA